MKRTTKEITETKSRKPRKPAKPKLPMITVSQETYDAIEEYAAFYSRSIEDYVEATLRKQIADEKMMGR